MTQLVRFHHTYFDNGAPVFLADRHYAVTEETRRCVAVGIAQFIEVKLSADKAEQLAQKAQEDSIRAQEVAIDAALTAEAAIAAEKLED